MMFSSCSEFGKIRLVGVEFNLALKPKGGYVVGRVWPTGLGTLPLRKPSAVYLE